MPIGPARRVERLSGGHICRATQRLDGLPDHGGNRAVLITTGRAPAPVGCLEGLGIIFQYFWIYFRHRKSLRPRRLGRPRKNILEFDQENGVKIHKYVLIYIYGERSIWIPSLEQFPLGNEQRGGKRIERAQEPGIPE
jgi:hypothetical protein